jgi:putative transcriptional regulator
MLGGPVGPEQGFIIHRHPELSPADTVDQENKIAVSATKEVLQTIIQNHPENTLMCLGYSAWKGGQLEEELAEWLLSPIDLNILFNMPFQDRWKASAKLVGVDFDRLSGDVGHG